MSSSHEWLPTESGHYCRHCYVRRLPPDRKWSRFKYRHRDGRESYWLGECPWRPSPLAGDPTKEGNGT